MEYCAEANRLLLSKKDETKDLLIKKDKCDKVDYLVAVGCGAIGGFIDIFLVGSPTDSKLGKWTDKQVDGVVMKFAKLTGWKPREGKENSVTSAIGYLEKKYKVNYDQRYSADVDGLFDMNTKNHHMKSLGHSPDIVGLFFSLLNQFTSTSSFVSNGKLITVSTETHELQGGNLIAKLFCGIANWIGHLMSDVAGASGKQGRGSGIVAPFYELFGMCSFGSFSDGKGNRQDLATIATEAFERGYDFRFSLTSAIPVVVTDMLIRLLWALRRRFQYKKPFKECIPSQSHPDLRIMIIVGMGTLCAMDVIDAGLRSGGNFLAFFMRLNLIAWFRLVVLVLKEVCLRIGIIDPMQAQIDAYRRINEAMQFYLHELEKIDLDAFKEETEKYNAVVALYETAGDAESLNKLLLDTYDKLGLSKPWEGDFDKHMSDKNAILVFE